MIIIASDGNVSRVSKYDDDDIRFIHSPDENAHRGLQKHESIR